MTASLPRSLNNLAFAAIAILGGLGAITTPIPFFSSGGYGRYGSTTVSFSYTPGQTIGFGVLFVVIGLFLFRIALEIRKPK